MAEYIKLEPLISDLEDVIANYKDERAFSTDFAATIVIDILNNIVKCQPAADVAPVVRCRDCKHSDAECHKDGLRYCMRGIRADDYNETGYVYPLEVVIQDDDFCSYGERKEGADDGID